MYIFYVYSFIDVKLTYIAYSSVI